MQIEVDRSDLRTVRVLEEPPPPLHHGAARLHVESFALTSNNITYAVFGEAMSYWQFFPAADGDGVFWGRVPVWGFATVAESEAPDLAIGTRVFGYFPMGDELVVEAGRLDESGFSDVAAHRQPLPSVYNRYSYVAADPIYDAAHEAEQMLLWPLFVTSFVVDDFLGDHGLYGASTAVISSASAKTAIGAAFLLAGREGIEVVGLTSESNAEFVRSLGCYEKVVTYENIDELPTGTAVYIDVAGRRDVTASVHAHFGADLAYSMVVGDTHWENEEVGDIALEGPRPTLLFAPDQIAKRRREWGRDGFEASVREAWERFIPWVDGWLDVRHVDGAASVESTYRELLDGHIDPRVGHVCTLGGARE